MIVAVIGFAIIAFGLLCTIIGLLTHGPVYHSKRRGASVTPQAGKQSSKDTNATPHS